jgi:hypothetical protein
MKQDEMGTHGTDEKEIENVTNGDHLGDPRLPT